MRGPRERVGIDSPFSELRTGAAGGLDSPAGTDSAAFGTPFADNETGGRFRTGRLRGRMFSPRT